MKARWILSVCVALAALVAFAASRPPPTLSSAQVDMNLRFAGTFISRVQYVVPSTGEPATSPLIRLKAKGSPGPCEISFFGGQDETVGFPPDEDCCGGPACLLISVIENPQVLTFNDLSLLFATGDGEVCIDLLTGIATGTVDLTFTGGTGRFEGATGEAVSDFEIVPVSSDGSFNSETGTTVGTIVLPDDDD